jgi:hypothetical protein
MIKKILPMLAILALAGTANADPITFDFSCESDGGADCAGDEGGSITINITDNGDGSFTYDIDIDNVSLMALVTGFGFDFTPDFDITQMSDFSVARLEADNTYTDVTSNWAVSEGTQSVSNGESFNGIFLDFIDFDAAQTGNVNAYAIANNGTLDGDISFNYTSMMTVGGALMRLQRTGTSGEGSLKLVASTPPTDVPEPGTLGLLGLGLLGLGLARRRKVA